MEYETTRGPVTITEHHIVINNKLYNIHSEQLSIGEWETWDLQEKESYIVHDPIEDNVYRFTLYFDHDWELEYLEDQGIDVQYYRYKLDPMTWSDYYYYVHNTD